MAVCVALAACGAPTAPAATAGRAPAPAKVVAGPGAPAAHRTGPPPAPGTLGWYLDRVPRFGPPPAPTDVTRLTMSGPAALYTNVPVDQPVAFLTIDDGWTKDPDAIALLRAAHIPFTMFLTTDAIRDDPAFFRSLESLGGVIEDHTITHSDLSTLDYARQVHEICGSAATLTAWYGRRPVLMRAPYGDSDAATLRAAASCGIRATVYWNEMVVDGKVEYQRPGGIHPGDMVLMHFKPTFREDFLAAVEAFHASHVTPALLENYLVTTPPAATAPAPATPGPSPQP